MLSRYEREGDKTRGSGCDDIYFIFLNCMHAPNTSLYTTISGSLVPMQTQRYATADVLHHRYPKEITFRVMVYFGSGYETTTRALKGVTYYP